MRFALLGSGSRGNAMLVQAGATCVMVDCGFSVTETVTRLARLQVAPQDISALLLTHEHADHVNGVARFAGRFGIPVHCSAGTLAACEKFNFPTVETFDPHTAFTFRDFTVEPLAVPHDAREPTQFIFSDGHHRLAVLTDTGSITEHIRRLLQGCHALVLEANHDTSMLENGPYPPHLKSRVGGPLGHLSNAQAAALLDELDCAKLQHLVAAHMSEKNNTPALVREVLAQAMGCEQRWIQLATQEGGLDWRELGRTS